MRGRWVTCLAILCLVAAACTGPDPERADTLDFPTPENASPEVSGATGSTNETTVPSTPTDATSFGGRLAVMAADGSLETMRPDGSSRITLAEVDSDRVRIQQPAWSSDGQRLAWVRAELRDDATVTGVIETATADGRRPTVTTTDVYPFYLSWDPTSSRIGYLGSLAPEEIGFGIVELDAPDERPEAIDSGQPFYLSWGPDGRELLAHIGEDRLERLGIDGKTETVTTTPGTFNVPVWTEDGSTLIYGSNRSVSGQALVAEDARTGERTPLLGFPDGLVFVASPDGSRIAYQMIDATNPAGPLMVLDVASGEEAQLVDHLVAAFFWSPDGRRLLYLDPTPTPERFFYRWGVWDGETAFETQRFVPSLLMVGDYLPFFEQYAQSMRLWSPDSEAFAYAGMNEAGETGIWVQEARRDRAPVLVSDGELVTWSPA